MEGRLIVAIGLHHEVGSLGLVTSDLIIDTIGKEIGSDLGRGVASIAGENIGCGSSNMRRSH